VDWDSSGINLLATYVKGIHHLGIYKTVPVVVNTQSGQVEQLRYLPDLVSQTYWAQTSDKKLPDDIRVMGYSDSQPNSVLLRLVGFKPQEVTLAFYGYDLKQGTLTPVDPSALNIAQNGWLVQFLSPRTARQEPLNVSPQEAAKSSPKAPLEDIEQTQYLKPKKFWLN
jgi:hypothetical protein